MLWSQLSLAAQVELQRPCCSLSAKGNPHFRVRLTLPGLKSDCGWRLTE